MTLHVGQLCNPNLYPSTSSQYNKCSVVPDTGRVQ